MNYQYNIGCSLSNLKDIRDFIRRSLNGQGISDVVMNEIVLALDEMCSNLMIHSHNCNPDHELELHIEIPRKGEPDERFGFKHKKTNPCDWLTSIGKTDGIFLSQRFQYLTIRNTS